MKPAAAGEGGGGGGGEGGDGKAAGLAPTAATARPPGPAPSEKVVHSRSQALFCNGTKALLGDALKQLVPRSTAFMSSDAELWDFLCSLKHEFSPVILRSKDVYGYASCRAVVPELPRGWDAQEARPGCSSSGSRRSSRSRSRGGGAANAAAASDEGKRPPAVSKTRRRGGRGGGSAKPAAKKRKEDAGTPALELRACDGRPEPRRRTPLEPEPLPSLNPPLAACPPVKVRGDIWKRRNLEAARRRAQRLLGVDLQPVVRLRRIPGSTGC